MSVAIIKKIGRRIFGSLYSLIVFIVFISTMSVYITLHSTNNKKDTNGKDDEDKWRYKTDNIKKKISPDFTYTDNPNTYMYISVLSYLYYGFLLFIACIVFLSLCRRDCIRGCLKISYNWLFRRNQVRENEPAVHYRDNRIYWRERGNIHLLEYSSDEAEL